ncbi:MAG: Fic family protein [Candidatus Riflebacteria bacterium]|nr:Fic family protein [Candidatus Riflebacteria bacterium]
MYIYQYNDWPNFRWDEAEINTILQHVHLLQAKLLGKMDMLGFDLRNEANLKILTQDILKSSEIEGELLNIEQVRSSVARRLGLETAGGIHIDRNVEGIVDMMLDATRNYNSIMTLERLFGWHASLFPSGYNGIVRITTGRFRDDKIGPMQVVSGYYGKEKVHYQAPAAEILDHEMNQFISWLNKPGNSNGVLRAAIAHFWFVTLHPFEDGNGRIARALSDMLLAKAEGTSQRFYSISAQIRKERNSYYEIIEKSQKHSLDITKWLVWFLNCVSRAIEDTQEILAGLFNKAYFWRNNASVQINERQKKVLNLLFDSFDGKLTSSKWAKLCKCSQDTAQRDIQSLLEMQILKKCGSGRSTNYELEPHSFRN